MASSASSRLISNRILGIGLARYRPPLRSTSIAGRRPALRLRLSSRSHCLRIRLERSDLTRAGIGRPRRETSTATGTTDFAIAGCVRLEVYLSSRGQATFQLASTVDNGLPDQTGRRQRASRLRPAPDGGTGGGGPPLCGAGTTRRRKRHFCPSRPGRRTAPGGRSVSVILGDEDWPPWSRGSVIPGKDRGAVLLS
jgi:hypothetical protein